MSELKTYYCTTIHNEHTEFYIKSEADKLIADKDTKIRELTRALWMHRAIIARHNKDACKAMREFNPFIGIDEYNWQEVERKCLKKAEEFK